MEEVAHDPAISNTTVAIIASAITLVGTAVLGLIAYCCKLYFTWRKGVVEVTALQGDVVIKQQKDTAQLRREEDQDQIDKWRALADRAQQEKQEEHDRAVKEVAEANLRTLAERETCRKEMIELVARYRAREEAQTKQMQEREIMFDQIATNIRKELGEQIGTLVTQNRVCAEENGELKGRVVEMEKRDAERAHDLEELKARLGRLDMREVTGRKPKSKPEIDLKE